MRRSLFLAAAPVCMLLAAPFAAQAARPGLVAPPGGASATALSVGLGVALRRAGRRGVALA